MGKILRKRRTHVKVSREKGKTNRNKKTQMANLKQVSCHIMRDALAGIEELDAQNSTATGGPGSKSKKKNKKSLKESDDTPSSTSDMQIISHIPTKKNKNITKNLTWQQQLHRLNKKGNLELTLGKAFPESIPEAPHNPLKLNEDQVPIVLALYKKHKQDYDAMERDIRINKYQWNKNKCEKYIEGYCIKGSIKQRSMEAEMMSGKGYDFSKQMSVEGKKRNVFGH